MNHRSKEFWRYILDKTVGTYRLFIKDVESVQLSLEGNYLVEVILESDKNYFFELSKDIVQEFLNFRKTSYCEWVLDKDFNLKEIVTDFYFVENKIKEELYENK